MNGSTSFYNTLLTLCFSTSLQAFLKSYFSKVTFLLIEAHLHLPYGYLRNLKNLVFGTREVISDEGF